MTTVHYKSLVSVMTSLTIKVIDQFAGLADSNFAQGAAINDHHVAQFHYASCAYYGGITAIHGGFWVHFRELCSTPLCASEQNCPVNVVEGMETYMLIMCKAVIRVIPFQMEQEEGQKKPQCRRSRRKPSNLRKQCGQTEGKDLMLETHIWHAKRMHMVNKYNYRLANHCNDKGIRAAHRSLLYGCLLSVSGELHFEEV